MIIYPAIDLMGGRAVRLRRGDPRRPTAVGEDPAAVAQRWEGEGAAWLHVVDLDGALHGTPQHLDLVRRICNAVAIPVQVGGGLRTLDDLRLVFEAGAARAILGTSALDDALLAAAVSAFGGRLAVALDARDGRVAVEGWRRGSGLGLYDAATRLASAGVARFIYTDIARDGMLAGPDLDGLRRLIGTVRVPVIASGGITTADDLRAVQHAGAEGAIVGRALYDGCLSFAEALSTAGGRA